MLLFFLSGMEKLRSQPLDTARFNQPVILDEVMVHAQQDGFDVAAFIKLIKEDTTFYKAFRSLHLQTFNAINEIQIYNKSGNKVIASLNSETKQIHRKGCRWMNILDEKVSGDFYKRKKEYRYYTAKLYATLFFTRDTVCGENNIVKGHLEKESLSGDRLEKSITQLKYLMFFPGRPVPGIPVVGKKVAIFEPEVAEKYDFKISAEDKNGIPCYLFEAIPKPNAKKVVIKRFKTWLSQQDYSIVSRDYSLSYNPFLFDFEVQMQVDLAKYHGVLLPTKINYNGNWHILTKKREIVRFNAEFDF